MEQYVGLDVSQSRTAICVIDNDGACLWQGVSETSPAALAEALGLHARGARKIAMETGPLAVWLWHGLRALGLPVVCVHARYAAAALSVQFNKTDANDAHGLAQIVRAGWYREVEVKSLASHELRALLVSRQRLVSMRIQLYNPIRGLLKTFGVILPAGKGAAFAAQVAGQRNWAAPVRCAVDSLLAIWTALSAEIKGLDRELARAARADPACRRFLSVPGVGVLTAVAYRTTIDAPSRFRRSRSVGAYLGLTPKTYQSGEVDRSGRVSKCGDRLTRALLFEAANAVLFRARERSALMAWGEQIARRSGWKKARVAMARKLAVILHRLWVEERVYRERVA